MKKTFYTEAAYGLGLLILAIGTALMEAANLGMSMVVAPAYLFYLRISKIWSFFTFGMAEYLFQAVLLLLLTLILRKFRVSCLFSFVTAVLYGLLLDGVMLLTALLPTLNLPLRFVFFLIGMLLGSVGVSLLFHTYLPPEAYELFVKEIAARFRLDIHKVKTFYDCASCLLGILLSFLFFGFGHFEGVKLGTVFCALVNGFLISRFTLLFEKYFTFSDRFALRDRFDTK